MIGLPIMTSGKIEGSADDVAAKLVDIFKNEIKIS